MSSSNAEILALNATIKELQDKMKSQTDTYNTANKQRMLNDDAKKKLYDENLKKLTEERDRLRQDNASIAKKSTVTESRVAETQKDLATKAAELRLKDEEIAAKHKTYEAELKRFQEEITSHKDAKSAVEANITTHITQLQDSNQKISTLEAERENLKARIGESETNVLTLQRDFDHTKKNLEARLFEVNERLKITSLEKSRAEKELTELNDKFASLTTAQNSLVKEHESLISKSSNDEKTFNTKLNDLDTQLKQTQTELRKKAEQLISIKAEHGDLTRQLTEKVQLVEREKKSLIENHKKETDKLNQLIAKLNSDIKLLEARIQAINKECSGKIFEHMTAANNSLKNYDELYEKYQKLEIEMLTMQTKLNNKNDPGNSSGADLGFQNGNVSSNSELSATASIDVVTPDISGSDNKAAPVLLSSAASAIAANAKPAVANGAASSAKKQANTPNVRVKK